MNVKLLCFAGSFVRALRFWATHSPAALEAARAHEGDGFKLSDKVCMSVESFVARGAVAATAVVSKPSGSDGTSDVLIPDVARRMKARPHMQGLYPIIKRGRKKGTPADSIVGPCIPCHCETDIFAKLGLNYVPPQMRVFNLKTRQ